MDGESKKKRSIFLVPALMVFVVVGLAAGGYYLFLRGDNDDQPSNESGGQTTSSQEADLASRLSETYNSPVLRFEVKYPSGWTVSEAERGVRIESPSFKYTTVDKGEVEGKFKVYIRKGARTVDGKYLGRGFAVQQSEKITYTDPALDQRKDTFLTVFGLDKPDNFAYFIVQGNFDLKRGQTLGESFAKEAEAYLIFGGYGASDLEEDLATNILPINAFDQTDEYKLAVEVVKSLKLR